MTMMTMMILMILRVIQNLLERPRDKVQGFYFKANNLYICTGLQRVNGWFRVFRGGTRWRSWLRHCSGSRKVAGSIPDGIIGIFHWHNPSGRTMTLGSTEMSTKNISWGGKGGWCVRLTTLPPSCSDCLEVWEPQPPGTLWASPRPVMGLLFFTFRVFRVGSDMKTNMRRKGWRFVAKLFMYTSKFKPRNCMEIIKRM